MGEVDRVNVFDEIQSLCREYRKRLKAGQSAGIDEVLGRIDDSARENLFQNLLHIDVEFRRQRGENPTSDEYLRRFPRYAGLIRQAFFESTMMSQEFLGNTPDSIEPTMTLGMPAARKLGEYELLRELGRGGFGVVYEARHLQRGDRVALKTLPMSLDGQSESSRDAERLHRFRREFRSLSEINHPNLAGMQTLEVDGNQWFFTMDLIEGVDFLQYVCPLGKLDEPRLRASLKQLVRGIIALHDQGIVHRDLKPSNVLVGDEGHVTILDFGLVTELQHLAGETLSIGTKHFAGTPRYAAPEQASGQRGEAVDWYALGTMLYEALTGDAPFKGSAVDLLIAKQTTDPPALSERNGVPKDVAELVDAMLRREPKERPSDQQIADAVGVQPESSTHDSSSAESSLVEDSASTSDQFLVGRESQLAALDERLSQFTSSGQAEAVLISGRSGEGKTSLADTFLSGVRRDGQMLVLAGRCYDRESVPFKAIDCLVDPLVAFLRSRSVDELAELLPNDIGMLAQLFPVLRRVEAIADRASSVAATIDSRQIRYRAFAALRELLTKIGRHRPVILFIDDLQWGDADSAGALHEVLRPPESPAVLLLGSYRSDEAENSQFLTEWREKQSDGSSSIEQSDIEVAPLNEEQCVLLVANRLGIAPETLREQSGELFEDTQGNPYFIEQLIEGFDPESHQFRAVPLEELIERKLSRLPPAAKTLLEAVAIAGQAASMEEVAAVVDASESAFSNLTHMRSERLIRLIGSDQRQLVDTYHDKIRETVVANLDDSTREELHVRFGDLIESIEGINSAAAMDVLDRDYSSDDHEQPIPFDRVFDLAYHFHSAGDPRGFVYQLLAGEKSFRAYASEDAVGYLGRARASLPEHASDAVRFRLCERHASALARLRVFEPALEHFEQALKYAKSAEARAHARLGIGRTHQFLAQFREATESFDQVLREFGVPRPSAIGMVSLTPLLAARVFLVPYRWQRSSNKSLGDRASWEQKVYSCLSYHSIELEHPIHFVHAILRQASSAIRTGQTRRIAHGLTEFGGLLSFAGLVGLGQRTLRRASNLTGDSATDEQKGMLLLFGGMTLAARGEHATADAKYRKALPLLIKCGLHLEALYCVHFQRHLYSVMGSSRSELEFAREVLRLAEANGSVQGQCWGCYDIAVALARGGQIGSAYDWVERAREFLRDEGMNATGVVFLAAQGFVLMQSSDYETARLGLEKAWQTTKRRKAINEYIVQALPWLLECSTGPNWLAGAPTQTAKRLKQLCRDTWMISWIYPNLKSQIQRSRGRAFAALGKKNMAIKCLEKSIQTATDLDTDYDRARGLLDLAAVKVDKQQVMRSEAITLLKKQESVIPYAERWLLGDQYDPDVVAPAPEELHMEDKGYG